MRTTRRCMVLLLALGLMVGVFPGPSAAEACWNYKDREKKFARKINKSRSNHGDVRLDLDRHISKVARKHTNSMVNKYELFHTSNLGGKVTNWASLAENVGYGYGVKSIHKAFMNSSVHRSNILRDKYRFLGVGTKKAFGWVWVTEVFESKNNPGTTLNMPKC